MNRRARTTAIVSATALLMIGVTPSANAAATNQTVYGTQMALVTPAPNQFVFDYYEKADGGCGTSTSRAVTIAVGPNDYLWAGDACADGRSAVAMITWKRDGFIHTRTCINNHGKGTWARCDFDWPDSAVKMVYAGTYASGVYYIKTSSALPFRDD